MLKTRDADFLFADARGLYEDALEMLEEGRLRNAAEKAWCATKRATDALILARTGVEPRTSGQTMRRLRQLRGEDPSLEPLRLSYGTRNPSSTAPVSMMEYWSRRKTSFGTCGRLYSTSATPRRRRRSRVQGLQLPAVPYSGRSLTWSFSLEKS